MPKLILSRKGFDSSAGGGPSPILGDQLLSLPIPQAKTGISYQSLMGPKGKNYAQLMQELGIKVPDAAHHDPDLAAATRSRKSGWRPTFGQTGAALRHLQNEEVGEGDLFLFFGWFRQAEISSEGNWRFVKKAPDLHVLFGYLEIGRILDLNEETPPDWARDHPHWVLKEHFGPKGNALFLATEQSSIWKGAAGGGELSLLPTNVLTDQAAPKVRRSLWHLPSIFFENSQCMLSYHRHKAGLAAEEGYQLDIARRGQEFVSERTPAHDTWLKQLVPT